MDTLGFTFSINSVYFPWLDTFMGNKEQTDREAPNTAIYQAQH